MAAAFGRASRFVPLLIPFLCGVDRRIEWLQHEGECLQALAERDVPISLHDRRAGERFLAARLASTGVEAALVLFDVDHFNMSTAPADTRRATRCWSKSAAVAPYFSTRATSSRWGGEQVLIVLPCAGYECGERLAQQMRAAVHTTPIASSGVTGVFAGDTLAPVPQRADDALYRAKAIGRDRVDGMC